MNGNGSVNEDNPFMDRKPIVTCAGELEVFSTLEEDLSAALPQDSCEWRRSLGRPVKSVHIGANFAPYSPTGLPKGNQWDLIRQPLFHVYWTECNDVDTYKVGVRDEIEMWLKELTAKEIYDWLIVVVENYDGKRANKLLPRTTVLDKIRADFAPKQGDRCISVINPGKVEGRSADSWRGLVLRIRHLLLVAYAKAVGRLEDHVRQQREKRNELGWNFMQYFHLQEELAQVLEMLGLYDEALVQYDELDALFSQFVVNGHTGENVDWLNDFQKPLERWHGLKLHGGSHSLNGRPSTKTSLCPKNPSLLELRAYLYSKQAQMLLLTKKQWEMASRCLPFLHTCTREISLLEISSPTGAISCWLFLAAMEVLQVCDKHNQADQIEAYSLHTACLWAYSSQKLRDLGVLCGLLPGDSPTSAQLHLVVGLSAGMGDNPGAPGSPSPTDKLKEALCSKEAFNKTYLELAELAMGTYKHIGRLRSARLIGREVASFYMLLGEIQTAAAFLSDAVRTFEQDGWKELVAQTQIELAECYKKSEDVRKYIRTCAAVCAAPEIDNLIRWSYYDELKKNLDGLDKPLIVPFKDIIKIQNVCVKNKNPVVQDGTIEVELHIESNFPREVLCSQVVISLEVELGKEKKENKYVDNNALRKLRIHRHLDYKQDKQLSGASVVCHNPPTVKRSDSIPAQHRSDFNCFLDALNKTPIVLTPGVNVIRLTKKAVEIERYYLGQIAIRIGKLELLSAVLLPKQYIEVRREEPTVRLDKGASPLLSGIEQIMHLSVTIGSYEINPNTIIKLTGSRGLSLQCKTNEALTSSLEITLEQIEPFSNTCLPLRVLADLPSKDHQVTINCPWAPKPIPVSLSFTPPLITSWKLYTAKHRKFVQVSITGQCEKTLRVESPCLKISEDVKAVGLNINSSQDVTNGLTVSYLWEILMGSEPVDVGSLKADFAVDYFIVGGEDEVKKIDKIEDTINEDSKKVYHHYFTIKDYQTLYQVDAHVEPTKGSEFCRVGALCHLHLSIKPSGSSLNNSFISSLMYEVVAEQSVWAVCGRTAGVVSFESDPEPQTVVLDVMPLNSGNLPLPIVRLSKYIPADYGSGERGKPEMHPRLQPFSAGQVYNSSKGQQVYVIASANETHVN